jgi:plasmid stabilization system protein ParE
VLADEQNEVLDMLRRGGTIDFADVVPAADEHVDRFAIAATPDLDAAAAHGAALAGVEPAASCDELAAALGRTLVAPLRARIERSFDDGDGDLEEVTERLRALYREWKGNHIGIAVRHFTVMAYARGAYDAAPDGSDLRWLVDRSCEACPDCDDNALAGKVAKGEAFPTGDAFAPAHPDCRCLVVAAAILDVA